MINSEAGQQDYQNLRDIQKPLQEIIAVLENAGSDVSDRAKRLKEAVDSLDGKTVPQQIGDALIKMFKTIPEAYHLGTPEMNVFLGLGVTLIKNEKGDYSVHSAPEKPDSPAEKPAPASNSETFSDESGIDVWRIADTRDYHEVPNVIAYEIAHKDSYRFQHGTAPGNTFSWSNGNLRAEPGDEKSDSVLKGNLLEELRSKKVKGSVTLSTGERIEL